MNILFTCNEFPPYPFGGQGTFVYEISQYLAKCQHTIIVYGSYPGLEERTQEVMNGVLIIRDPLKFADTSLINILHNRRNYARAIAELASQFKVDIIEAHDTGSWFLFIKENKPLFIRLHNGERYFKNRGIKIVLLERLGFILKRAHIIGVSEFILREFKSFFMIRNPFNSYSVIYNGLAANRLDITEDKAKSIVYAGTLKRIKGLDVLIKAFTISRLSEKGYTLNIYGKDTNISSELTYWQYLLESINELPNLVTNKSVYYNGPIQKNELLKKFSQAEICVFPSHLESFGLVVLEAMSMGALVIYTNQGAATEIIEDGKDGFLVQPDDFRDLAKKMLQVVSMSDIEKRAIRGKAFKKSLNFSIEYCAKQTISLYESKLE